MRSNWRKLILLLTLLLSVALLAAQEKSTAVEDFTAPTIRTGLGLGLQNLSFNVSVLSPTVRVDGPQLIA